MAMFLLPTGVPTNPDRATISSKTRATTTVEYVKLHVTFEEEKTFA
jgi:phosphohistidine phosphatase SixA